MLRLEQLARQVVAHWASNQLQVHVRALARHLEELDGQRRKFAGHIEMARLEFTSLGLEFDDNPLVSASDKPDAAFVNAWVWIDLGRE
ncbi:MAG: hypothetical protein LBH10_05700 [Burkholderiaceae bacterium]|jgi:hypothetical protein|nr:hypothetical protein [Burkholderiaceae bacterium]